VGEGTKWVAELLRSKRQILSHTSGCMQAAVREGTSLRNLAPSTRQPARMWHGLTLFFAHFGTP
jgi:hypothetical protein